MEATGHWLDTVKTNLRLCDEKLVFVMVLVLLLKADSSALIESIV